MKILTRCIADWYLNRSLRAQRAFVSD